MAILAGHASLDQKCGHFCKGYATETLHMCITMMVHWYEERKMFHCCCVLICDKQTKRINHRLPMYVIQT